MYVIDVFVNDLYMYVFFYCCQSVCSLCWCLSFVVSALLVEAVLFVESPAHLKVNMSHFYLKNCVLFSGAFWTPHSHHIQSEDVIADAPDGCLL